MEPVRNEPDLDELAGQGRVAEIEPDLDELAGIEPGLDELEIAEQEVDWMVGQEAAPAAVVAYGRRPLVLPSAFRNRLRVGERRSQDSAIKSEFLAHGAY